MGKVSGYILQVKEEQTVYIISDSIITDIVKKAIKKFTPGIMITNSSGGIIPNFEKFLVHMDEEQTIEVAELSPISTIIAIHPDSIDFRKTSRKTLLSFTRKRGISYDKLIIPADGEVLEI